MKKILLYIILGTVTFTSCKRDEDEAETVEVVSVETQNVYDDQAAQRFLLENYFDDQGKMVSYSATDPSDDNIPSLNTYNPIVLPSGVIVVKRPGAQPGTGVAVEDKDVLRLTSISFSSLARNLGDGPMFTALQNFRNSINTGVPEVDPSYFYIKNGQLKGQARSFYEIEGFQEGIKYFESCEIPDADNYNMQGVIIVPSRAAFARDQNAYDISTINGQILKFTDRSFVFNVQIYKATTRTLVEN